jgi:DnaJ-class molecular chaperone
MTENICSAQKKIVICKRCNGTGWTGTQRKRSCRLCHGRGTVEIILIPVRISQNGEVRE